MKSKANSKKPDHIIIKIEDDLDEIEQKNEIKTLVLTLLFLFALIYTVNILQDGTKQRSLLAGLTEENEDVGVNAVSDAENGDDVGNELAEMVKKIGNQQEIPELMHRRSLKSSKPSPIKSSKKKDFESKETSRQSPSEAEIGKSPNRPLTGSPKSSSPTLQEQQRMLNKQLRDEANAREQQEERTEQMKILSGEGKQISDGIVDAEKRDMQNIMDLFNQTARNTCLVHGIKEGCTVTVKSSGRDRTFIVDDRLGKGHYGAVWSASEQDGKQLKVAIKFQQTKKGGFFENEAKVTNEIHELLAARRVGDHTVAFIGSIEGYRPVGGLLILDSNKVQCVDVIVMGLFDIDGWDHFAKNRKGNPEEALEITKRITNVAQIMWNKGLIARDIKVDNIFLKLNTDNDQIESSAMGDHGMVIDKNKLISTGNWEKYFRSGTWLSPYALLQFFGIGHDPEPKKLDIAEHCEKLIQSDVVYDINMAVAFMLLSKKAPVIVMDVFQKISIQDASQKSGDPEWLRKKRDEFWGIIEELAMHINDKEKFKERKGDISMEELMVWTFWASFKQIEDGGNEDYMVTLDEYAKVVGKVKLEYENVALNKEMYEGW